MPTTSGSDDPGPTAGEIDMVAAALHVRDRGAIAMGASAARRRAPRTAVGVLDRSVAVLEAVEDGHRTFTAIQRATGLTPATTHRLIAALEWHGFLFLVGGFGYALGPRLLGLAATAMRELPLRDLARPALEHLARISGESAQLYIRNGDRRICIDAVGSEHELRTIVEVGASLPLDRGSAGHVLLAYGPRDPDVPLDDALERTLVATRRRGWAHSHGEREAGVASVSAPVFGPDGSLLAAVSMSGPASRILPLRAKDYAPIVTEAAAAIQVTVGGAATAPPAYQA